MAPTDELQTIGQQLTSALVTTYGSNYPGGNLVFLPGGVSVADDIVQNGVVNWPQMQALLQIFDYPFVISTGGAAVLLPDQSHGTTTQIYSLAVSMAQASGLPSDDAWKRITAEIAMAQSALGPPNAIKAIVCEPDDWPVPPATGTATGRYWTVFDSTHTESSSQTTTVNVPVPDPRYWKVRSLATAPAVVATQAARATSKAVNAESLDMGTLAYHGPTYSLATAKPALFKVSAGAAVLPPSSVAKSRFFSDKSHLSTWQSSEMLFAETETTKQVTTTVSSTITVHLEHQCVSIARNTAGQPWWNGLFLADPGWTIPGIPRGGLLPAPTGAADAVNGLPIALIVVQNLNITGQWSQAALDTLKTPGGTVGPLSLFGATATTNANGSITFAHPGMQVVALLCSPLPVLPPLPSTPPPSN